MPALKEPACRVVEKQELFEQVWKEKFVTDNALTRTVKEIRHALGDSAESPRYIETVHKRGYRFIAELSVPAGRRELIYTEEVEGVSVTVEEEEREPVHDVQNPASPQAASTRFPPIGNTRRKWAAILIFTTFSATLALSAYFVIPRYLARRNMGGASSSTAANIRSIAVLPLANLTGDPAQEYFADGMTEALISHLTQIRALRVTSRTSAMRYKGNRGKSLPEIARELNVDAVLEGTVQRSGGRVHVTARLILAAADSPSWSREYDRDESDVLKLQSDVARAVANEIRIQVTAEERARLASARNIKPQAHEAYLLGRYHLSKNNEQDMNQAIEYFERATQIAPDYAAAYAGLSDAWLQRGWVVRAGAIYKGVESQSRAAALKAIALDEQLAEAHNSLGRIKLFYDWDWVGAEHEFKRALELDPGSVDAHIFYGHLLGFLGRDAEAIREGQIAVQLDPLSSTTQSSLGRILFRSRKYQDALTHQKRAVELEPRNAEAYFRLGDVYVQVGRYDQAIAAFKKVGELAPEFEGFRAGIARVYALTGREREARQMINGLKADPMSIAVVYVVLGDKDEAFRVLEKAVEERSPVLVPLKADPLFESLHSDPRMKALLRRLNYPI